jgi:hypothetical protein
MPRPKAEPGPRRAACFGHRVGDTLGPKTEANDGETTEQWPLETR